MILLLYSTHGRRRVTELRIGADEKCAQLDGRIRRFNRIGPIVARGT